MEEISESSPALLECNACFKNVNDTDVICGTCGYPLNGSEEEQRFFISVRDSKKIDLEFAYNKIKRAGYALFYIAGATIIFSFIQYATNKNADGKLNLLIINIILSAIYTAFGFWSRRKPLTAIISGIALYVIIFLLNAIASPLSMVSGAVFKIFIIVYFIRGIRSAIEAKKIKKELNIE